VCVCVFYFPFNPVGSNFELEAAQIGRRRDRSIVWFDSTLSYRTCKIQHSTSVRGVGYPCCFRKCILSLAKKYCTLNNSEGEDACIDTLLRESSMLQENETILLGCCYPLGYLTFGGVYSLDLWKTFFIMYWKSVDSHHVKKAVILIWNWIEARDGCTLGFMYFFQTAGWGILIWSRIVNVGG
jgi:hypothetical protein